MSFRTKIIGSLILLCLVVFATILINNVFVKKEVKENDNPSSTSSSSLPIANSNNEMSNNSNNDNAETQNDTERELETEDMIDLGGGAYVVSGGNSFNERPGYQIIYYAPDNSYTLSLLKPPLGATRKLAEKDLSVRLGVSEAELCSRKIRVTVPNDVDTRYSGKDLLMSSCPGAVALP